jgi:hypothetical protein
MRATIINLHAEALAAPAQNLVAAATALGERPIGPPPSDD